MNAYTISEKKIAYTRIWNAIYIISFPTIPHQMFLKKWRYRLMRDYFYNIIIQFMANKRLCKNARKCLSNYKLNTMLDASEYAQMDIILCMLMVFYAS